MPIGSPKPQTIASRKWNKKAGYRVKSFSIKGELLDRFSEACKKTGQSQAGAVAEFMERYIEKANN